MVSKVLHPCRACPEASARALTPTQRTWLLLRPSAPLTEVGRDTFESFLHANSARARGYEL
jgi:hypothetical protein